LGTFEEDSDPARAEGSPLRLDDLASIDPQHLRDPRDERVVDRAGPGWLRRAEREAIRRATDGDQAGAAFLDDLVVIARPATGDEPGVAGPQCGVAGEGQLVRRVEDAHRIVGGGIPGSL
jgi:hypothetical protein